MEIKVMKNANIAPYVVFSETAYYNMLKLFRSTTASTKEFMFIGTVSKTTIDQQKLYLIEDIKLIPQESNSGAFCETDDDRYPAWLHENFPTVEQKRLVRLNGHSHVYMAVEPSSVDDANIEKMMQYVDDFFIQLIMNKKQEIKINLWDKESGLIFNNCTYYLKIGQSYLKFENSKTTVPTIFRLPELKIENFQPTNDPYIFKQNEVYLNLLTNSTSIISDKLEYNPFRPIFAKIPESEVKDVDQQFKDLLKQPKIPPSYQQYMYGNSLFETPDEDYWDQRYYTPKKPKKGGKK